MKDFSPTQMSVIEGPITEPQYLLYVELDQPYFWSTRETADALGETWIGSNVQVDSVSGAAATFRVENDAGRHSMNALSGAYRYGAVRIYWAYPVPDQPYVEQGYWDDDYVSDLTPPTINLMFSGAVYATPVVDFWLTIQAESAPPRLFPFKRIRPPFANHLPPAGYMIEFGGQILRVEGARRG